MVVLVVQNGDVNRRKQRRRRRGENLGEMNKDNVVAWPWTSVLGHAVLVLNALVPLVVTYPSNINVIVTASVCVFCGCWRSVKPEPPADAMTKKVGGHVVVAIMVVVVVVKKLSNVWSALRLSPSLSTYLCVSLCVGCHEVSAGGKLDAVWSLPGF